MRAARRRWRLPVWGVLIAGLVAGCGGNRGKAPALRQPSDTAGRTSGCIDTPFIGGDVQATGAVQCGREGRAEAVLLTGRVVGATSGLPGAGLEGLWVGIHNLGDGAVNLAALPPPMAETETGPQGRFTLPAAAGELMLAVRVEASGRLLAAQRLSVAEAETEIQLVVELDDELRRELGI